MLGVLRIRDYRLAAASQLLSSLGDWLLLVAAPFFVLRLTGSTLATGLSMAAETVPALVLGPVAGVFADRWDRRRTMLTCDLLRAGTVSLMLLVHRPGQVWLIYAALIGEAAFGQFFAPSRRALIPALVGRGAQLGAANSLAALIGGTVRLVGGPLGGALFVAVGFAPVVAVDAGSYLASAVLITAIGFRPDADADADAVASEHREGGALRRFTGELRAGAAHVRSSPGMAVLFASAAVFFLGNAMVTALLVAYTGTVLHAAAGTLGLLFSALGVGYLAGAPVSRFVAGRWSERSVMVGGLAVLGAVFAATFNIHSTVWDLALFTLIGPPAVCFLVTVDTYIGRRTPDHVLGRVGSVYGTLVSAVTFVGMVGGAVLGAAVGIAATVDIATAIVFGSAAAALLIPRPIARTGAEPEPEPEVAQPASRPRGTTSPVS